MEININTVSCFIVIGSLILLANVTTAKENLICPGRISNSEKNIGWRYSDSDYFGGPKLDKVVGEKGEESYAAVLYPSMKNSRFIFIPGSFGPPQKLSNNMRIKVVYKFSDGQNDSLFMRLVYRREKTGRNELSEIRRIIPERQINGWCLAKVPISEFSIKNSGNLERVHVFSEYLDGTSKDRKLYVSEISIVKTDEDSKMPSNIGSMKHKPFIKTENNVRKRYCAIFPKPFWYTDKKTFYAPQVYKNLYNDGFNVIGVPGTMPTADPKTLPKRVERFIATGMEAAKYPGMMVYPKITMCWSYPDEAENRYSRMTWFNGFQQELVCPVDDLYWQERIIPLLMEYVKASEKVPVFAIMFDWEIYAKNKFRGVYGVCYCDKCWNHFKEITGISLPGLEFEKRNDFLIKKNLRRRYCEVFYEHLKRHGKELRAKTDELNPKLSFWFIPAMGGAFLTNLGRELATKEAPIVVSNESTYGKPSLAISDDDGLITNLKVCRDDLANLTEEGFPFRYLAAIMGSQHPDYHGRQAIEMGKLCDGIWVWELPKVASYQYGRDRLMSVLKIANKEIREGKFRVPEEWLNVKSNSNASIPTDKYGVALSGIKLNELKLPEDAFPLKLEMLTEDSLKNIRLIILQNFNAALPPNSPTVKLLREYVNNGGRLFLTHDTGFFMASPFPEIVNKFLVPKEKGDPRHILDTNMTITENSNITSEYKGESFQTSFNDHLVFKAGKKGMVLLRDRYGYSVVVAGVYGKGKVVFSGCYYRELLPGSLETKFTQTLVDWLLK